MGCQMKITCGLTPSAVARAYTAAAQQHLCCTSTALCRTRKGPETCQRSHTHLFLGRICRWEETTIPPLCTPAQRIMLLESGDTVQDEHLGRHSLNRVWS